MLSGRGIGGECVMTGSGDQNRGAHFGVGVFPPLFAGKNAAGGAQSKARQTESGKCKLGEKQQTATRKNM